MTQFPMCVSNIAFLLPSSDSNHLRGCEEESRKDKKEKEEEVVKEEKEKLSNPETQDWTKSKSLGVGLRHQY